jgi:sugar phosphate isomerase/epimerase
VGLHVHTDPGRQIPGTRAKLMATAPRLIATYFTLAGDVLPFAASMASPHPLSDRIRAAARAGYAGIGLHTDDLLKVVDQHGYAGVKQRIADGGLQYLEIEALLDWFADGDRRRLSDSNRKLMLDAAERLGAFQIKVVGDLSGKTWPVDLLATEFATLCRQAADVGANVSIEVLPFSTIRDIPTAVDIVASAAAPNGGLLIDVWHMVRGGIAFDEVAEIPVRYLKHVELDDADETVVGSLFEDTVQRRRLPGDGSFDLPHFLRCVQATGYDGLYGVEILSDDHRALALDQAAQLSFQAAMAQFGRLDSALPTGCAS